MLYINTRLLTESLYGTFIVLESVEAEPRLASVDMTLSNVISDLSASDVAQLSVHCKRCFECSYLLFRQ